MTDEGAHVGSERERVQVLEVIVVAGPRLPCVQQGANVLVGDRLDAAEEIGEIVGFADGKAQAAAAEQHGRDAVANGLGEPRAELDLSVVVRVTVDEAWDDPLTPAIHHLRAGERSLRHRHDASAGDADVANCRGSSEPVEDETARQDGVELLHAAEPSGWRTACKSRFMMRWHLAAVALVGCTHAPAHPADVTTTSAILDTRPRDTSTLEPGTVQLEDYPTEVWTPNRIRDDAQLAAVVDASNDAVVALAKVAVRRASDGNVRELAQLIYDQRRQARNDEHMLMTSLGILPSPTDDSRKVDSDAAQTLNTLIGESVRVDFDRAFIAAVVRQEQHFLETLDEHIIPDARLADFKRAMMDLRAQVADHVARARGLLQPAPWP